MPPEPIVRLEGITVRYGSVVALDGLRLELHRGEVVGLLGPNGAGKSTTLRVLVGQQPPDGGRVRVAGYDLARDWAAVKPLFGYVPDRANHFEEFSGQRNLRLFAGLYHLPPGRADECLGQVGLATAADVPVRAYSLGMRRKLLLARALLHRPRLLYLDEPTANLDPPSAARVRRLLRGLAATGCTVLLTTHDLAEAGEVCDRVVFLSRGRLVARDAPAAPGRRPGGRPVDVVFTSGERRVFDLDLPAERAALGDHIAGGAVAGLRSRAPALPEEAFPLPDDAFC
jgi:ABC-2 type transport system ATP-binding protein